MHLPLKTVKAVEWTPQEGPQTEILTRSEKELLFGGSRGGGKTEAGLAWLVEPEYVNNPMYRSLVIRKDYDDLNDWLFRAKQFYSDLGEITGRPAKITWKAGGETRCGHWKDKETIGKYLGHEYQKILLEEITQGVRTEEEYQMILGSCRSSIPGLRAQVMANTNPGGKGHKWVKSYFVDKAKNKPYYDPKTGRSRIFIPSKITDNKILCKNDPDYVSWLNGLTGPLGQMWRDGDWDVFEGQFFSSIGMEEPCFEIQQSALEGRLFGSLDGGTTHKTSFGLWWIDEANNIHRIFSYARNGLTHQGHAQEIYDLIESCKWTKGFFPDTVYADPALWTNVKLNEQTIRSPIDEYIDLFRDKLRKTNFTRANNNRVNGCQVMQQLLRERDGISQVRYFDIGNRSYVDGMQMAMTDPNNPETYMKMDGDDECFGADTKVLTSKGNRRIADIRIGDQVVTRFGLRRVVRTMLREADVYDWGGTVVTGNHPIITNEGKKSVLDLTKDDILLCISEELSWSKRLSLTAARIVDTLKVSIETISCTFNAAYQEVLNTCIETFGGRRTGLYQMGLSSITPMGTLVTTSFPTYNAYLNLSTCTTTQSTAIGSDLSGTANCSEISNHSPKSGTPRKPDTIGTSSTSKRSGIASLLGRRSPAYSAARRTKRWTTVRQGFVPTSANLRGGELLVPTMSPSSASGAEPNTYVISTKKRDFAVSSVQANIPLKYAGRATVYNLTVEDNHEYFAEGVLVANCDEARYFLVAAYSFIGQLKQNTKLKLEPTHKELLLSGRLNRPGSTGGRDWYNV